MGRPICKVCNDTHRMPWSNEDMPEVMCTFCPTPCQRCRAGGNGPYCEKTPCSCSCHGGRYDPPPGARGDVAPVARTAEESVSEDNDDPGCPCDGKGWDVYNADSEDPSIQRCDSCLAYECDEDAAVPALRGLAELTQGPREELAMALFESGERAAERLGMGAHMTWIGLSDRERAVYVAMVEGLIRSVFPAKP